MDQYTLELNRATRWVDEPLVAASELLGMQRRHAAAAMRVFVKQIEKNSELIARGLLEPSSLLAMLNKKDLAYVVPDEPTAPPAKPTIAKNVFSRVGDDWSVEYGGKKVIVRHSVGMAYLSKLVAKPGEYVDADTLIVLCANPAERVGAGVEHMSVTEVAETGIVGLQDFEDDPVLGQGSDYLNRLRLELAAALKNLEQSKRSEDGEAQKKAQQQVNSVRKLINDSTDHRGRSRTFASDRSNARSSVSMAISRTFKKLDGLHPKLSLHLRTYVHTGQKIGYFPQEQIIWEI